MRPSRWRACGALLFRPACVARRWPAAAALLLSCGALGCSFVPKTKFDAAQSQNRTLTEQTKAQVAEIQNLKVHTRKVEDQLIKAEEDLARLDDQNGRNRQKLANLSSERDRLGKFSGLGGAVPPGGNREGRP